MKRRTAALCLIVLLLLPHMQTTVAAATPEIHAVTSFDELAYYVLQSIDKGRNELYFQGFDASKFLSDETGKDTLFALINAGTWKHVEKLTYGSSDYGSHVYRLRWTLWESQYNNVEAATLKEAQGIVDAALTDDMTAWEKYKELHDWLSRRVNYDLGAQFQGQPAWTALVARSSVCNGYAKAYKLLCDLAELPCLFITGTAGGGQHAWNMVPMNGQWLYIDTTWDDAYSPDYGYVSDRYFMLDYAALTAEGYRPLFDYTRIATLLVPNRTDMADTLRGYGLFLGSNKGYELTRIPTRDEVAVMLTRLLGLSDVYTNETDYPLPFTDVDDWAVPYVAVMYKEGITRGIGGGLYGSKQAVDLPMFCNFLYRALGYDASDYEYSQATNLIQERKLLHSLERQAIEFRGFTRGDLVMLCYRALDTKMKDGSMTLYEYLFGQDGANMAA